MRARKWKTNMNEYERIEKQNGGKRPGYGWVLRATSIISRYSRTRQTDAYCADSPVKSFLLQAGQLLRWQNVDSF